MKRKLYLVLAIMFLITAVMLLFNGGDVLLNYTEPVTIRLVSSEAYTVRDYSDDDQDYVTKYRCTWEYEYGGQTYTTESTAPGKPDSTATRMINPDDPAKSAGTGSGIAAVAIGGLSLALGLLLIKLYRR